MKKEIKAILLLSLAIIIYFLIVFVVTPALVPTQSWSKFVTIFAISFWGAILVVLIYPIVRKKMTKLLLDKDRRREENLYYKRKKYALNLKTTEEEPTENRTELSFNASNYTGQLIREYKSTKIGVYVAMLLTFISFFVYWLCLHINFFLSLVLAFVSWCILLTIFGSLGNVLGRICKSVKIDWWAVAITVVAVIFAILIFV